MRIRVILTLVLAVALILILAACGSITPVKEEVTASPVPSAENTPVPSEPKPSEAPKETVSPAEPALPAVQGADSVKTLLEKSLDYFHHDCDYSKIADVHDPQACLASWYILEDLYRDQELTWEQAMDKAALLFGSAEQLREKDPELARLTMDEMDVDEPEEALEEYMEDLKYAFQSGEITEDDPEYERLSQILTDWDKGTDYLLSHYPEIIEDAAERGTVIGLEGALELLQREARYERDAGDTLFRDLECEYRPENVFKEGLLWGYDMGYVVHGGDVYMVAMKYYVRDEIYYLADFGIVVGSMGG